MNRYLFFRFFTLMILLLWSTSLMAEEGIDPLESSYLQPQSSVVHKIGVGATYHNKIPGVEFLPLKNGDLSYDILYEYHEGIGFWQLGASYAPGPSDKRFDYVITPELSLILKDRIFRIGVGALKSYVKLEEDSNWTSLYWKGIAGIGIPIGKHLGIDLYANYLFKSWEKIADSDTSGLEYKAIISFGF